MLLQCKPLLVTVVIIKSFQFYPEYLLQVKSYQPDFDYRQGECYMKMNPILDLLLTSINLTKLLVLSVWFLLRVSTGSLTLTGIEFGIVSVMCLADQIMIQQWKDVVVCTNYKHLIHAYH